MNMKPLIVIMALLLSNCAGKQPIFAQAVGDYYLMGQSEKKNSIEVAFHIPIPVGTPADTNEAGLAFRDALVQFLEKNSDTDTIASQVPFLNPSELLKLQSGELFERVEVVRFSGNFNRAQKKSVIDARHTNLITIIQNRIKNELQEWGGALNVP